jgi:hypothetical protein
MGFKRFAYVNFDPPNTLIKQAENGMFTRPMGTLKTEVVLHLGLKARLKTLISGKIHVLNVVWTTTPPDVEGDTVQFCVLPPFEKIDPKLRISEHV